MVATIAQMASAEYYLESQRSYRHPNEYYTAGEEPDGAWFNPKGLFGMKDGAKVDAGDFRRLYNGFAPDGAGKLVQRAGSDKRSPGIDMTFSVDKSISALWAIAEPDMRAEIEAMAVAAARAALEDTVLRYCSYTRVARNGIQRPVAADLMGATFPHGTSRENDPQLHVHCALFNLARTHDGGKYRAHHQYPVYGWKKAAGAMFRANLAWDLRNRLGVRMERYGPNAEFTRITGMPEDLLGYWSKRRKAIVARAGELGIPTLGNASRLAGVNKLTRAGKSHDNDPEIRHRRWRGEAASFAEREELVAAVTGHKVEVPREAIRELTDRLDGLPEHLARQEAVFRRPDMVEAAANAAAGLMGREAVGTAVERLRRNPEIERLEPRKPTAESEAGMAHTEVYSTRHNLGLEQAVRDMAHNMAADTGHGLPAPAVEAKVGALLDRGYPLSEEQISAIRFATARAGRVAVIEGAAGSGKTTTLRPITDLHREHGYDIVPTAVAWRTAVALGDDCDARPYCVDKLLKLAAKGQIAIGKSTLIVVDEAGMLSTRQAHHILQLSERHGAKVVFAGDTRQHQPVEAGPGLRLIRDVAGSVRVDRIRRQKADMEDVLVHVHDETPEAARFQAGMTGPNERDAILAGYDEMADKPSFTPWQVSASEALRDGDAAAAIEALRVRGRLHLCHDEEKTLTRLVDDWERHVRAEPDKSAIVLARMRAEARALSYLMRERVLGRRTDIKRAVIEVSRDVDGRVTEPLEVAVGDRLRIGATQWDKQLFNGTVVTVEDLEVGRKKRSRTEAEANVADTRPEELSVLITARTDDGRRVTFRHDEIRDYKDNIRLDYGYALTIASAQGLTVDRAFLLADARPARETIYPAATRHREALDIYVNRAPLVFDITERRPEDQADQAVMDTDIRAHLAERWSRSQPKEAALDYIADGAWRDPREDTRKDRAVREAQPDVGAVRPSANDNVLARIAGELRRTAFVWRHGQAVAAFTDGRREVLAAYDGLRERTRAEGDAVALGGAFRETLTRHGVLLKQAEAFRARPAEFSSLLAERGGIGSRDLDAFEDLHDRASRHRRAATMRYVHRIRREAELAPTRQQGLEANENIAPVPVQAGPSVGTDPTPAQPDVRTFHEALQRDWNQLEERASEAGVSEFDMQDSGVLIARMRSMTENPGLPARTRQELASVLENHRQHVAGRKRHAVASPAPDKCAAAPSDAESQATEEEATKKVTAPSSTPVEPPSVPAPEPPAWRPTYEALAGEWNALSEGARQSGTLSFYSRGYAGLIPRIRALVENPDIPAETKAPMIQALENHQRHASARKKVEDWLTAVERHMDRRDTLEDTAGNLDVPVAEAPEYPGWRREAEHLTTEGKDILSGTEAYGAHLANITRGGTRMKWGLSDLRDAIREDAEERAERQAPVQPIEPARDWRYWNELAEDARLGAGPIFGPDIGSSVPPDTTPAGGTRLEGALSRLRRTFGWESWEDHMKKRAEEDMRRAQNRWEKLKQDWNRAMEQAKQAGIHVIYTRDYKYLRGDLEFMASRHAPGPGSEPGDTRCAQSTRQG